MTGIAVLGFMSSPFVPTTTQFLAAGVHTITIPQGASTAQLEGAGPGGGGGSSAATVVGQGGGSGGKCLSSVPVSAHVGQTFILTVGTAPVGGASTHDGNTGTPTTFVAGTFSGSFTSMSANGGQGGQQNLNGPGAGGTATGGNVSNTTGNASTGQAGAAGLTGTFVNGLNGASGANHPASTPEPNTPGTDGQAAVHFS